MSCLVVLLGGFPGDLDGALGGCPKRSMAKPARARFRSRKEQGWGSDMRDRVSAANFERCMRGMRQPEQGSIPIPIPISISSQ